MTKEQALQGIKLLSALESWGFSIKERMPDYLHEDLCRSMEVLEGVLLGKDAKPWVPLTDDQYREVLRRTDGLGLLAFYNMINDKLMENNHG